MKTASPAGSEMVQLPVLIFDDPLVDASTKCTVGGLVEADFIYWLEIFVQKFDAGAEIWKLEFPLLFRQALISLLS